MAKIDDKPFQEKLKLFLETDDLSVRDDLALELSESCPVEFLQAAETVLSRADGNIAIIIYAIEQTRLKLSQTMLNVLDSIKNDPNRSYVARYEAEYALYAYNDWISFLEKLDPELVPYHQRLAKSHPVWNFVACHVNDSWHDDWMFDGKPYFRASLFERGNDGWVVYCVGTDDTGYEKYNLNKEEAIEVFSFATTDGRSQKELVEAGFVHI